MKKVQMNKIFKQDGSLIKHVKTEKKKKEARESLVSAKQDLLAKTEMNKILQCQQSENKKLKQMIQSQKIKNMNLTFYDEKPVIIIQKYIRGWLGRRLYEKVKFQKLQEDYDQAIYQMNEEIQKQMILGEYTKNAALIIQKNVKIFLLRRKIKRLKRVFENYYLKSTQNFITVFTNTLLCWSSKNKIECLKFLKFREEKLEQIRRNLAILTVKNAVKQKKFNIRSGLKLLKRLNKRKIQIISQRASIHLEELEIPTPRPGFDELMKELEVESLSDQEHKQAQRLLNLKKLSYNIKDINEISLVPLLSKKYSQNFSTFKNTPTNHNETQKFRNLSINTPPLTTQKRMFMTGDLPSRLMFYPIKDSNWRPRPFSSHSHKVSENMNFLKPTRVFIRKFSQEPFLTEESPKKKSRPPSKKLMRNTISSLAKKRGKKTQRRNSVKAQTRVFDKMIGTSDGRINKNWFDLRKSEATKSNSFDRKEYLN